MDTGRKARQRCADGTAQSTNCCAWCARPEQPAPGRAIGAIALAAERVFGTAAIRRLGAERWFVNFSVAVTTCWILSELEEDEYFAGRDVEFPVDVGALRIDWRVEPRSLRKLVDHTTELACTDGLPASVRSLAGFIARRHLPQQAGAAANAARRELLTGRPTAEPGDLPDLSSAAAVIDWVAQASRRGPQLRLSYFGGPDLVDVGVLGKRVATKGGTPYTAALNHCSRPRAFGRVQHQLQQTYRPPMDDQTVAELREHRVVEPGVVQSQTQRVLPVQPGPYRVGGVPIGQILHRLQHAHQRQQTRRHPSAANQPTNS